MLSTIKIRDVAEKVFSITTYRGRAYFPPTVVILEVNDRCCLRCEHCNIWRGMDDFHGLDNKSKHKTLSKEEFIDVINTIRKWSKFVREILFIGGEPFMEPEIFDYIKVAHDLKFKTSVTTNGYLITQNMAEKIINSGLSSICISLDGPNPEVHDSIRGVKGSFDRALSGINNLHEAKKKLNSKTPYIRISTVVNNRNYMCLNKMPEILKNAKIFDYNANYITVVEPEVKEKTDEIFRSKVVSTQWIIDEKFLITKEEESALNKTIEEVREKCREFGIALTYRCFDKMPKCTVLWASILMDNQGNLFPCTMIRESLGNVRNIKLRDIWNNPRFKEIRNMINRNKLDICKRCCYYPTIRYRKEGPKEVIAIVNMDENEKELKENPLLDLPHN